MDRNLNMTVNGYKVKNNDCIEIKISDLKILLKKYNKMMSKKNKTLLQKFYDWYFKFVNNVLDLLYIKDKKKNGRKKTKECQRDI